LIRAITNILIRQYYYASRLMAAITMPCHDAMPCRYAHITAYAHFAVAATLRAMALPAPGYIGTRRRSRHAYYAIFADATPLRADYAITMLMMLP